MNVLSLFSGIGGLDLGLERAGMTVVGQVEIDPFCQRVLAKHWPEVPRHDDVHTTVEWWLGEPRPPVDVVCGGFPCQPVSLAGKRRAQADKRWLWPATWDVIRQLRPRVAVLENVPGLLVRGMGDVLGDLAEGGYDTEWDCIPAAAVGAPHLRDRVFILARLQQPCGAVSDAECDLVRVQRQRVGEQHGEPGPAVARADGTTRVLADAPGAQRQPPPVFAPVGVRSLAGWETLPRGRDRDVADAHGQWQPQPGRRLGDEWQRPRDSGWWITEPDVGRVAHGVPSRVDRLRGLGNAVVPQVAEHVGRLVMAAT